MLTVPATNVTTVAVSSASPGALILAAIAFGYAG